jgi:hypothetical protein
VSNLVIVAIPRKDDQVWKVSSEKVPHLTLLYLGESESNPNVLGIMEFVQHAIEISEHGDFMLSVDYRDTLGDDNADVVFFDKDHSFKWIEQFRSQLLQNEIIRSAYESSDQFMRTSEDAPDEYAEWRPHLTLGYPATPAKDDEAEHGIHWISFDRIAVWNGDYEGPSWRLKWPEMREGYDSFDGRWSAVEKTATMAVAEKPSLEEIIEHYGVKGMRWGVRKEDGSGNASTSKGEKRRPGAQGFFDPQGNDLSTDIIKSVLWPMVPPLGIFALPAQVRLIRGAARGGKAKAVDIEEKRFEKHAQSHKNFVEIHNRSGERFNREIDAINKKHPSDLTKDPKAQKKYDDEVLKLMQDSYREAANSIGNRNRTMHLDVEFRGDGQDFLIKAKEGRPQDLPKRLQHADENEVIELNYTGKIQRDATGHILAFVFDDPSEDPAINHTVELGVQFLMHYGVKGMRWGQRKSPPIPVAARAQSVVPHGAKRKTKVKTEGGENQKASEDAIRVAEAHAKLKKSGTAALSNKELQDVQTRLNLERNVKQLVGAKTAVGRGRAFVKGLTGFNREVNESVNTGLNSLRLRDQLARG